MKLGIFSWYGFQSPLEKRLAAIKQQGFQTIMLWWGDEEYDDALSKAEAIDKARQLDLDIENIHVPFDQANDLWSTDNRTRNNLISRHIQYVRECAKYKIPMMVMHISRGYDVKEINTFGIEALKAITCEAEEYGIEVAIENTRRPNFIEVLLDSIPSRNLGLCYDTSHGQLYEPSQFYLLKKYGKRVKCFHLSDNDGLEDRHWNIGQGIINWDGFIDAFPHEHYQGSLSLEVFPKDKNETETNHLANAFGQLHQLSKAIMKRTS